LQGKYKQNLAAWGVKLPHDDILCFNFDCSNKLRVLPAVYMFLLPEKDVPPLVLGVCGQCAQYSNDELLTLVRNQFGHHYGLKQQAPANSAQVTLEFPPGIGFTIAGVSFVMPGRDTPSIPGGPAVFVDLLEAGRLPEFMTLRRGISNCHGITTELYHDLDDAGCAQSFAFKRGSTGLLKSPNDPNGLHSWLEINGWAIDARQTAPADGSRSPAPTKGKAEMTETTLDIIPASLPAAGWTQLRTAARGPFACQPLAAELVFDPYRRKNPKISATSIRVYEPSNIRKRSTKSSPGRGSGV
jgi:hypothetical protein